MVGGRQGHSGAEGIPQSAFVSISNFHGVCTESSSHISTCQALCSPLVEELGIEYSKDDSAEITQLRTVAVEGAAFSGDPAYVIS